MGVHIINAPGQLCCLADERWWIDARNISGGTSLTGRDQVVGSAMPFWRAELTPVVLDQHEGHWRAFLASLRGRLRAVRLYPQCYNMRAVQTRFFGFDPGVLPTTHSDGSYFSDGSGYALPTPVFKTTTAISAFGRTVTLNMQGYASAIVDGDWLGIGGRARIVETVFKNADGTMTVTFDPPVSSAVAVGADVTTKPSLVMRLTSDDSGAFVRSAGLMPISQTISLVELPEQV